MRCESYSYYQHRRFVYKSERQLHRDLEYWKNVLGLQPWDIIVEIVSVRELPDAQAHVDWCAQKLNATIRLLDPLDWPADTSWLQDQELSLVHELMHIRTWAWNTRSNDSESDLEQSVETISKALVQLRRDNENGKKKNK